MGFGGTVLDALPSTLLQYLPGSAQQDWQARAVRVLERALGPSAGDAAPDDDLLASRRVLLEDVRTVVVGGHLDALGWPWFDERDVGGWMEFIAHHFPTAEAGALAHAQEPRRA